MADSKHRDSLRAQWQLELLRSCTYSQEVQDLPIQERRAKVIEGLRASLKYFKALGKQSETWNCYELCLIVERSTTIKEAIDNVRQRISAGTANVNQTPASNTGVTDTAHSALTDYVAGRKY